MHVLLMIGVRWFILALWHCWPLDFINNSISQGE